jgi:PAS domain S-box-containing protein
LEKENMIDWNKIPTANTNQNALANHSTHAIVVIDLDGKILMDNAQARAVLGYDTLEGHNIRDIAPPPYTMLFQPEHMEKGYGADVRQVLHKGGRLVWMTVQGVVLKDEQGAPWGVFLYLYDTTTEREMQAEIEHLGNKLRDVVSSIQQALNKGKALPSNVTLAEREIAAMVKNGMSCRQIAAARNMGVKSVENVRVALRKKLKVDRRVNLRAVLQDYGDL